MQTFINSYLNNSYLNHEAGGMAMQAFSESLPMMLYRALDAVMPPFRRIFHEFGLTEQQWRVLRVLWEQDAASHRELAALTLIPPPSLVGVLDRLAAARLIKRARSDTDRRHVQLRLTAAGRALEEAVMPRVAEVYADLAQSLDRNTWQQLTLGLAQLAGCEPPTIAARAHQRRRTSRTGETT